MPKMDYIRWIISELVVTFNGQFRNKFKNSNFLGTKGHTSKNWFIFASKHALYVTPPTQPPESYFKGVL